MYKYIYLISNQDGYYKIGVTKNNVSSRIKDFDTGNPSELKLFHLYKTKKANKIEKILHRQYSHFNVKLEWFELPIDVVSNFINICSKIEEQLIYLDNNKVSESMNI